MLLTKDELVRELLHEIRVLLHLTTKVDATMLDYRPTPKQRSLLELLQYLTIMAPIHLRTIRAGTFDMDAWRRVWTTEEATAKTMNLEEAKAAIAKQPALLAELVGSCSDDDPRAEIQMFGHKASRTVWIVRLVLSHYAAYRMQLFLYLKASGRVELNTTNLWGGMDAP